MSVLSMFYALEASPGGSENVPKMLFGMILIMVCMIHDLGVNHTIEGDESKLPSGELT